jgi:HD superfamily phosphohydrolase
MIEVDGSSIRLLDCPVVQRLRGIKQLGFSYLTYPSAEHTRFSHSLGMFGVVYRLLESSLRPSSFELPDSCTVYKPTDDERLDLLHASILHDVGHLPFSHAGEFAYQTAGKTRVGPLTLDEFHGPAIDLRLVRAPKLAELISVAITLSPRFSRFYTTFVRSQLPAARANLTPYRLASLMLGHPPELNVPGFAELISGRVLDADKLDYVNRDGLACGIPVGIDIGRLFLRSTFVRIQKSELNRLFALAGIAPVDGDQIHFIVNSSGRDTIEEVIAARTSLYHRVYFHQTTRNAERVFERLVQDMTEADESADESNALKVWAMNDFDLLMRMTRKGSHPRIADLASRLAHRRLPKRALVFGPDDLELMIPIEAIFQRRVVSGIDSDLRQTILGSLEKKRLKGEQLAQLEREIADECKKLYEAIRDRVSFREEIDRYLAKQAIPLVCVSPLQLSPASPDTCLVLQNHEFTVSNELHNTSQTSDAEDVFKASGYVLTDPPWREIAFLASRKVLAHSTSELVPTEFSLYFPSQEDAESIPRLHVSGLKVLHVNGDRVVRRTGLNRDRLAEIQAEAERSGYIDSFPFLATKPTVPWGELEKKFSSFEGQFGWRIVRECAEAFLWQMAPRWRDDAIDLLRTIEVLDRQKTAVMILGALKTFADKAKSKERVLVAPLSPNSGQEVRIALEENFRRDQKFSQRFQLFHSLAELADQAREANAPIALVDDNSVSGSQAYCQLASWMGVPRQDWPKELADEKNIDGAALGEGEQKWFWEKMNRENGVAICVAIGAPQQAKARIGELAKLLRTIRETQGLGQQKLFADQDSLIEVFCGKTLGEQPKLRGPFADYLRQVGASIYCHTKFQVTLSAASPGQRKVSEENALGFGNMAGQNLTFRNVPVSTLTPIWCPGVFEGRPWMPLAARRGYVDSLVLG